MSVQSASEAVQRLKGRDRTLRQIHLLNNKDTDEELAELADCLLAHPDAVTAVHLSGDQLTDQTGVKLARYLAASFAIESLYLSYNRFSPALYLAVAAALRVNSSLRCLYLSDNQPVDRSRLEAAFVEALQLNPVRPADSMWRLYSFSSDFNRLKQAAEQLGHPSLQQLLAVTID